MVLLGGAGQSQSASKPDPFLEALRKREAAVKVVDITFSLKEILLKNNPTPMANLLPSQAKVERKLVEDVVLESTNRLVIQGKMTRFEGAQPVWHLEQGKPLPDRTLNVTNSKGAKAFYPVGRGKNPEMSGAIPLSSANHYFNVYYVIPLGLAFRGLDRNFTPLPTLSFKLSPIRQRIGERESIEYANQVGKEDRVSYFVDPQVDHNVVRILYTNQGKVTMQIDIIYAKNPVCEWVPDSWVAHNYTRAGKLERRTEVRVVSSKFNEPLPEDQFDIVFPPGTRLYKASEQKYYRVQPDGGHQLLTWSHDAVPLLVPSQADLPWYGRYLWWIVGGVGAFTVAAVLLRRRWRVWLRN